MGTKFTDKYSLLHFATGIVAFYWNIGLNMWIFLHILFEYVENTTSGMFIINKYITYWPGGKNFADSITNSIGDTIYAILGWLLAKYTTSNVT